VNSIFLGAIATAAITTLAVPSLAQHQPTADEPVSIGACSVVPAYDSAGFAEDGVPSITNGANVWISFQNRSPRTATDVTFLLSTPGDRSTISDRGRFSSGVEIRHTLGPFADLRGDETCALYSVRFDDGQVWKRP
jgi:hypothetical protein